MLIWIVMSVDVSTLGRHSIILVMHGDMLVFI
jgi:hypothetical protein